MTQEQQRMFDVLLADGRYRSAVIYAANIILGAELASKIIIRPTR